MEGKKPIVYHDKPGYLTFFFFYINARYRREEDSDEELIFDSDDDYDSDVPQDSLGNWTVSSSRWACLLIFLIFSLSGIDVSSDESDKETKKKPKKVHFAEAIKAATNAVQTDERKHPLLTDLNETDSIQKRKMKADKWFMKVRICLELTIFLCRNSLWIIFLQSAFQDLDDEADEDIELDLMARENSLRSKGFSAYTDIDNHTDDEEEGDDDSVDEQKAEPESDADSEDDDDDDSSSDDGDLKKVANGKDSAEGKDSVNGAPAAGGQGKDKDYYLPWHRRVH